MALTPPPVATPNDPRDPKSPKDDDTRAETPSFDSKPASSPGSPHENDKAAKTSPATAESGTASKPPSTSPIRKLKTAFLEMDKTTRIGLYLGAGALAFILVFTLLFSTHIICFHKWQDATCTEAKTCTVCGKTEGAALGHHWKDATCTEAKTCTVCGQTEGKPLGHDEVEATCTEPAYCTRCGKSFGGTKPHTVKEWTVDEEPTCASKGKKHGTCTICGQTAEASIAEVAHTPGDWEITKDVTISKNGSVTPGERSKTCTVCGKVIETEPYKITLSSSQKNALSSASSYLNIMAFSYSRLIEQLEYEGFSSEDATFAADHCGADWNEQAYKSAKSYLELMPFSRDRLFDQLIYEGFSEEQARYGVDKAY